MRSNCSTLLALSGALTMLVSGCTHFSERHYFRMAQDGNSGRYNYFRVTVKGSSYFSSVRYVSGYFDEKAVDQYFNEIKPSTTGAIIPASSATPANSGAGTGTGAETPAPASSATGATAGKPEALDGKKGSLVMILSSDPTAVVNAIGAFADQEAVQKALTNLLNRDKVQGLNQRKSDLAAAMAGAAAFVTAADQQVTALGDDPSRERVEAFLLMVLQRVASDSGAQESFATLPAALSWFQSNRSRVAGAN